MRPVEGSLINLLSDFTSEGLVNEFTGKTDNTGTPTVANRYQLARVEEEAIQKEVSDLLAAGIIRESISPYSAPCRKK